MRDRDDAEVASLKQRLVAVRHAAIALEASLRDELDALGPDERTSAANLVHYLAVRQFDLRRDQRVLARLGLSSLGRAEGHIMTTLDAVLDHLGDDRDRGPDHGGPTPDQGAALLNERSRAALGPEPDRHRSRLMVTLPSEAADDPVLVDELVAAGMAVARINGAHDDPDRWHAMATAVRAAAERHGNSVRIAFDLPGPKIRVGTMTPGPAVLRIRPRRDDFGIVIERARIVLHGGGDDPPAHFGGGASTPIPVSDGFLAGVAVGDAIELVDTRGRRRRLEVTAAGPGLAACESDRTSYVTSGLPLRRVGTDGSVAVGEVGILAPGPAAVVVSDGDRLDLVLGEGPAPALPGTSASPGAAAVRPDRAATIHVPEAAVFTGVSIGERVLIDDGEIEAVIIDVDPPLGRITCEVVRPARARIRPGKGINLPDSDLSIEAMTDEDGVALAAVVGDIDLVAMSYVGTPDDIERLHAALEHLGAADVGVILKIENRRAFDALPRLLIRALRRLPVAVMVARGDLAVEVGFERLAEVQEEILWLCEAAHVPVIWATQVLETLAKRGSPTRAEVTDAAWACRAECVMLNKGPHIVETLRFLDDVLARMQQHQDKRTPMLRRLSVAEALGR